VITMEHVNRLTEVAAPDWAYPPDGHPGVHRVVVEGNPGVTINTHVGTSGIDHNQGGVIATAARAVNVIDTVCRAPSGILAAHDLRPTDHVRGVLW
jgi:2,4-diaminopentanoate dehydrogenase